MSLMVRVGDWLRARFPVVGLVAPLLGVAVFGALQSNVILERIIIVFFINVVLVVGLQMFMGNSGILSFAHIGFMGLGAYASVLLSMSPEDKAIALPRLYPVLQTIHLPFWPALFLAVGFVALLAALVGFPLMRLSGAASVIATFALLVIIHVVLINWDEVTNGARTIFGVSRRTTLPLAAFWGVLVVVLAYLFKESGLGLKLRASREEELAAAAIGIDLVMVRWVAFILSAAVVALGGALWAHFITSFSPVSFYLTQTFLVIAMLIVGGTESVAGAVVGTVLVTLIFEGLRAVETAANLGQWFSGNLVGFTEVFLAAALIALLILRPAGVTGGRELRWPGKEGEAP